MPSWTTVNEPDGTYTIQARATDKVGNTLTGSAVTFVLDKTQPTAAITYSPSSTAEQGSSLTITATFTEAMAASPAPRIAISGANTLAPTDMTRVDATHYTYTHTVATGSGTATVSLSTGTDVAGNAVTSTPTSGATFTVVGSATQLAFVQQPTNVARGSSISPAVTVEVRDASGSRVTSSTASISLALGVNPNSATLGGTTTVSAVNGLATFSNLTLSRTGTGYTLVASSSSLTGATSNAFNVTGAPLISVGAWVPDLAFSTPGFIMRQTGRSFTVDVTITDPGSAASGTGSMVLTTTTDAGGGNQLSFLASGSGGLCLDNCTGAPTYGSGAVTGGGAVITFNQSAGLPPFGAVYRFTVPMATIMPLAADATDSLTANYTRSTSSGAVAANNTLRRYSLEITDISPPSTSANAGATINPVMTVFNRSKDSIADPFLTAGSTTLSGSAFSSAPGSTISGGNVGT